MPRWRSRRAPAVARTACIPLCSTPCCRAPSSRCPPPTTTGSVRRSAGATCGSISRGPHGCGSSPPSRARTPCDWRRSTRRAPRCCRSPPSPSAPPSRRASTAPSGRCTPSTGRASPRPARPYERWISRSSTRHWPRGRPMSWSRPSGRRRAPRRGPSPWPLWSWSSAGWRMSGWRVRGWCS